MAMLHTMTLPGKLDSLYPFLDFVSRFAREQGFSSERISKIALALEEVLVNIIKYAYQGRDAAGDIEITCKLGDAHALIIDVVDSGAPFDICSAREPDVCAGIDERRIGGLGIFFVKQFMDDVRYHREEGRNRLTLVAYDKTSS
jgi:serine/threonine-protein kinase RsbW